MESVSISQDPLGIRSILIGSSALQCGGRDISRMKITIGYWEHRHHIVTVPLQCEIRIFGHLCTFWELSGGLIRYNFLGLARLLSQPKYLARLSFRSVTGGTIHLLEFCVSVPTFDITLCGQSAGEHVWLESTRFIDKRYHLECSITKLDCSQ